MNPQLQQIPEWHDVDTKTFKEEITTQYRPAVLRGIARHWPVVQQALKSPESLCRYLNAFDSGKQVEVLMIPPDAKGRIFYKDDLNGFNFLRNQLPVSAVIDQIARYSHFPNPPSVAVQSALIEDCLPGFSSENELAVLDKSVLPRIWIGNAITTPAHIDESNNIACVVSGKRRFTLFPPDQVSNLYLGPVDFTPTGSPISMVAFSDPDFKRFPRFKDALAAAQVAELEPGDAIYIPTLWWHHVESLQQLNILVNYWWKASTASAEKTSSAFDCLLHCLLNMKDLAPEQREAWGAMFNHYLFNTKDDPAEHIPVNKRGVLGKLSPEQAQEIKAWLVRRIQS
jgi:oxalate decarboxylase/phosphoglucose isomerase-like protein (cupin superfamily)